MLISVQKRFVFVANTKAASTSIEAMLAPHAEIARPGGARLKHISLGTIRYDYGFLFDLPEYPFESFFRFGVFRDPVDWLGSWFRFRKGNQVEAPLPAEMTFAEFWAMKDWNIRRTDGEPLLQRDMFCDGRGELMTDILLPYDRIDALLPQVMAGLGIEGQLRRLNVSVLGRDELQIPAALHDEIREYYAADYRILDDIDRHLARGLARLRARGGLTD
jgi:hypothetical protein